MLWGHVCPRAPCVSRETREGCTHIYGHFLPCPVPLSSLPVRFQLRAPLRQALYFRLYIQHTSGRSTSQDLREGHAGLSTEAKYLSGVTRLTNVRASKTNSVCPRLGGGWGGFPGGKTFSFQMRTVSPRKRETRQVSVLLKWNPTVQPGVLNGTHTRLQLFVFKLRNCHSIIEDSWHYFLPYVL